MANGNKLINDPNFWNLIAGIGAGLDPEGVGGAIGRPTIAFNKSNIAAKALAEQEASRKGSNLFMLSMMLPEDDPRKAKLREEAFNMLAGIMTPPDKKGLTSIKMGPKGNIIFDWAPADASPLEPQGPQTQDTTATTSSTVGTTAPGGQPTLSTEPRKRVQSLRLDEIVPFY